MHPLGPIASGIPSAFSDVTGHQCSLFPAFNSPTVGAILRESRRWEDQLAMLSYIHRVQSERRERFRAANSAPQPPRGVYPDRMNVQPPTGGLIPPGYDVHRPSRDIRIRSFLADCSRIARSSGNVDEDHNDLSTTLAQRNAHNSITNSATATTLIRPTAEVR